jgi:hypothetical protein
MFACSTGNPPDEAYPAIALACKDLGPRGHYLTLHEYGGVGMPVETLKGTQPYHALRYRRLYEYLFKHDALAECIITEAGQSGGSTFPGTPAFIEDFAWYDSELMKDPYLVGAAAWSLGGLMQWAGANIQDALPALADYIIAHPHEEDPLPPPVKPRGAPRVDYARVVNVIPPDVTEQVASEIFLRSWRAGRQTTAGSYDDAGIGDLSSRRAVLWELTTEKEAGFEDWYATNYPGVDVSFESLATAPIPPPPTPPPSTPAWAGLHMAARSGPFTTGVCSKLSDGGGEDVSHSSPVAGHGFREATGPYRIDQIR